MSLPPPAHLGTQLGELSGKGVLLRCRLSKASEASAFLFESSFCKERNRVQTLPRPELTANVPSARHCWFQLFIFNLISANQRGSCILPWILGTYLHNGSTCLNTSPKERRCRPFAKCLGMQDSLARSHHRQPLSHGQECIASVCFNSTEKETETRKAKEFAYSVTRQEETISPGFMTGEGHLLPGAWVGGTGRGFGDPMGRLAVEVVEADPQERP